MNRMHKLRRNFTIKWGLCHQNLRLQHSVVPPLNKMWYSRVWILKYKIFHSNQPFSCKPLTLQGQELELSRKQNKNKPKVLKNYKNTEARTKLSGSYKKSIKSSKSQSKLTTYFKREGNWDSDSTFSRSSHRRFSIKISAFKNFPKFTGKHLY